MQKINYILCFFTIVFLLACEKDMGKSREQDEKRLAQLYNEIKMLAANSTCDVNTELNYKALGNKACGGPTDYVAYSSTIDTTTLINKIQSYTQQQSAYNEKYDIVSDCRFLTPPKSITCQDGKPIAIY